MNSLSPEQTDDRVVLKKTLSPLGLVAGVGLMEFVSHWVQTTGVGSRQVEGITLTLFRDPSIDLSTALLALIVMVVSGAIAG